MVYFIIVLLFLLVVFTTFILSRTFTVKPVKHAKSPEDIGIDFEEVRFPTKKGIDLYGWWIPHPNGNEKPTIILVHGWKRNVERVLPYIEELHDSFNLLAFDARNHGSSGTDSYVSMPRFAEDIISAIDFLKEKNVKKIGVLGLSIGGAAAIYAAARDHRIRSIVAVGAFAEPGEVMKKEIQKKGIPYYPLGWLILEYVQFRIKNRFSTIAPENNISKTKARIMIIHGKSDQTTPYQHAERLKNAAIPENFALWSLEGKGHSDCHEYPDFWNKLENFLKESFN
jgi:pimeloyl-ACP methyl ester carboxylesterase